MSKAKKILSVVCLLLLTLAFVGCGGFNPSETSEEILKKGDAENQLTIASDLLDFDTADLLHCTNDIEFVTANARAPKVTYTWEVVKVTNQDGEEIENVYVSETGKVTRPVYGFGDVYATVKVVLSVDYNHTDAGVYKNGTLTVEKQWTFTIEEAAQVKTIGTTIAEEAAKGAAFEDTTFNFENVIVTAKKVSNGGFFVNDSDGTGLYIYDSTACAELNIGDVINIQGTLTTYYSIFEGTDVSYEVVSTGAEMPTPIETTVSNINATVYTEKAEDLTVKRTSSWLFKLYAKLTYDVDDSSYYLCDPYTGEKINIYYSSEYSYVPFEGTATSLDDVLTPYVDQYVNIVIAYYDYNSSYANHRVMLTSSPIELAQAPELSDNEKLELVKAEIDAMEREYNSDSTITLITSHVDTGATISWASDNSIIDVVAGTVGSCETKTTVTLTATIVVGSITDVKEIEVYVAPTYTLVHAGTEADPYSVEDMLFIMKDYTNKQGSTEQYYVQGTIASVKYTATYSQGKYELVLVAPEGKTFEFYSVDLPAEYQGLTEALVGKTLVVYGYAQLYGTTYEICRYKADGTNYSYPTFVRWVGAGTVEDPYSVNDAVWYMADFTSGTISTEEHTVTGVVTSSSYSSKYGSYTIYLQAPEGAEYSFELYSVGMDSSIEGDFTATDALVGYTVTCTGYMTLYVNSKTGAQTYELSYLSATKSPTGEAHTPQIISAVAPAAPKTDQELVDEASEIVCDILMKEYKGGQTIDLITEYNGVTITWSTTESSIINISTGLLEDVKVDTELTLNASIVKGEITNNMQSCLTIKPAITTATLADIEALTIEAGATTSETYEVTVVLGSVYNTTYGNANILGSSVVIYGMYDSTGATRYDAMTEQPVEGDIITIQAAVKNYVKNENSTIQFMNAKVISIIHPTDTTLAGIVDLGIESGATTEVYYRVTATIAEITGAKYGNATLVGSDVVTYGMYDVNNVRYDKLASKPVAGDEVVLVGKVKNFNGTIEFLNAIVVSFTHAKTDAEKVAEAKEALTIDSSVKENKSITLPETQGEATVTWVTSNAEVLTAAGAALEVTENTEVTLTATITVGEATDTKEFTVTVENVEAGSTKGTEADPFTVEEAVAFMSEYTSGQTSEEEYSVQGVVISSKYNTTYGSYELFLETPAGAEYVFEFYSAKFVSSETRDFSPEDALVGYTIKCTGFLKLYVGSSTTYEIAYISSTGSTPEMVVVSEPTNAEILSHLKETLKVTSSVAEGGSVTLPATYGIATVTWATSNADVLSTAGAAGEVTADTDVTLTATIAVGEATDTKEFTVKVTNKAEGSAKYTTTFGEKNDSNLSSYSNSAYTCNPLDKDGVAMSESFTKFWTSVQIPSCDGFTDNGCCAVICPVRKNNATMEAYIQFAVTGATSIEFKAGWWGSDAANASKISKFVVQVSTDGNTWTDVSVGGTDALTIGEFATLSCTFASANYVRIYALGDATYKSNQSARIIIDDVVIK